MFNKTLAISIVVIVAAIATVLGLFISCTLINR